MTLLTCPCNVWQTNIVELQTLNQQEPFRYCPWCGQRLDAGTSEQNSALLAQYQTRIEKNFFRIDEWNTPEAPNMLVAARPVIDYRAQTNDILGTLDLMLTFVETGTHYTNEYGDMDEPFYEGLELMLDDFRDLLLTNDKLYTEGNFGQRLQKLMRDAGWLGWGYGDYVTEQVKRIQKHFGDL